MINGYKDLLVWQKAMTLVCDCYQLTTLLPISERYGITTQLRRAATSVAANVAEGHGRRAPRDFHRFLDIAYGSLNEVMTYLHLLTRLELVEQPVADQLLSQSYEVARMINGLQRSLRSAPRQIPRTNP